MDEGVRKKNNLHKGLPFFIEITMEFYYMYIHQHPLENDRITNVYHNIEDKIETIIII